jgi:hypothetical protein
MTESGRRAFVWLVTAFGVYACIYIFRLSFVVDGVRYFTLTDDQMISMRYAENLAGGHGLVWNAGGPRVEGYTNFLWVVYMALFHWLQVPRPVISLCVQASGAAFLLANLFFVRNIAWRVSGHSAAATLTAVAFVAFYIPLDNWAFQGTEVSILTLTVTAGVWLALRALDSNRVPILLFVLLGAATLVRPDMVVFAGAIVLALVLLDRRTAVTRVLAGITIGAVFLGSATVFRLLYFGDALPNTYYLKVVGFPMLPKMSRGLIVTGLFVLQLIPLIVPIWTSKLVRRASRDVQLLLTVFTCQVLYSIVVGGDAWEWWGGSNRFIAIAMPLFLICAATALIQVWARFTQDLVRLRASGFRLLAATALPLVVGINILLTNCLALSGVLDGTGAMSKMLLLVKPQQTDADEQYVRAALAIRDVTDAGAVIAVTWAGAIPYFSQRQAIDLLGKMDPRIAHQRMHLPEASHIWSGFLPGHLKWDYKYSIDELKPDVIQAPLWHMDHMPTESTPSLDRDYDKANVNFTRGNAPCT